MYYKVLKNGKVIDLLTQLSFIKYQPKHELLLLCDMKEAQAVLSSDGKYGWHIEGLYNFAPDNSVCVIKEITKYEYDTLNKAMDRR